MRPCRRHPQSTMEVGRFTIRAPAAVRDPSPTGRPHDGVQGRNDAAIGLDATDASRARHVNVGFAVGDADEPESLQPLGDQAMKALPGPGELFVLDGRPTHGRLTLVSELESRPPNEPRRASSDLSLLP